MKKFVLTIICVSLFFIGLGGIIEKVGANFKSDEKALVIIRQARQAIGGDAEIQKVKSLTIIGKTTKNFELEGVNKAEQGDLEINLQMPDKFQKMLKVGRPDGSNGESKEVNVVIMRKGEGDKAEWTAKDGKENKNQVEITIDDKDDQATAEKSKDGKNKVIKREVRMSDVGEKMRHNELLRTTLFLLLTAPEGVDVAYTYAGEGNVDGSACDIIDASSNGETFKLYLDKTNHLPKMMAYKGLKPFIIRLNKKDAVKDLKDEKEVKVFTSKLDKPETADFQVKFSNFKSVNGLQLPFTWTQTMGDKADEVSEVSSYEVNPANIGEKFKEGMQQIKIRSKQ